MSLRSAHGCHTEVKSGTAGDLSECAGTEEDAGHGKLSQEVKRPLLGLLDCPKAVRNLEKSWKPYQQFLGNGNCSKPDQ